MARASCAWFLGGTPAPLLFPQANESGVAALDSAIGPGGDHVVPVSAISSGAFLSDFDSVRQKRQRDLALLGIAGNESGNVAFDGSFADRISSVWMIAIV